MSKVVQQGTLNWEPSTSEDVAGYNVYYSIDEDPTYDSTKCDVGDVTSVTLPLPGQEPAEGAIHYGISAYDKVGNESDIEIIEVSIDTTPPAPPTNVTHEK